MSRSHDLLGLPYSVVLAIMSTAADAADRPRARDIGLTPGLFDVGQHNAITDVAAVRVGHATVHEGTQVHTGVTAIVSHGDNVFLRRVPAAIHVANGFGISQFRELGALETAILLAGTLCLWSAVDKG